MNDKKSTRRSAIIGAIAMLIILSVVLISAWSGKCDSGASWLSCNVTGTWGDWLGTILFVGVCGFVVYFGGFKQTLYNDIGSSKWNFAWIIALAVSIGLMLLA